MRLLLDTHALLWFVWNHPNLSETARSLMTDPKNTLLLSAASIWEIAIKVSIDKLTLAGCPSRFWTGGLVEPLPEKLGLFGEGIRRQY